MRKGQRAHNIFNFIGQTFNMLTVVEFSHSSKSGRSYWLCQCSCGNLKPFIAQGSKLKNGRSKSCGCLKHKHSNNFVDITNQKFGRWTVIKFLYKDKDNKAIWLAKCSCDNKEHNVVGSSLRLGLSTSCGCYRIEVYGKASITHNLSGTRLHRIWANMIQRCTNPNNPAYKQYGGKGINVCLEWKTFEGFYKDVIESYNKHVIEFGEKETTLDRWPNQKGNYESNNFRWATYKEQALNTGIVGISENPESHSHWKNYLSTSISRLISQRCKTSPILEPYLGCSLVEFRRYIESLWLHDMTWYNYGYGEGKWNLDHKVGCNNFDLSKEEDRKKCYFYMNYQPLWHGDHMKKSKYLIRA